MARDYILNLVKQRAQLKMAGGTLLSVIAGIIVAFQVRQFQKDDGSIFWASFGLIFLVAGVLAIIEGIRQSKDPMKAKELKQNPDLFRQAEDILNHEIYKDKYIALSERVIANASDYLQMAYRDEVFLVYLFTQKTNGVTTLRQLKLETARGTILIGLQKEKDNEIHEIIGRICENCWYARAGYTPEGLAYLKQMRELWKKEKAGGQMA